MKDPGRKRRAKGKGGGRKKGDFAYRFHWSWAKMNYVMFECKDEAQQNGRAGGLYRGWLDCDLPDNVAAMYDRTHLKNSDRELAWHGNNMYAPPIGVDGKRDVNDILEKMGAGEFIEKKWDCEFDMQNLLERLRDSGLYDWTEHDLAADIAAGWKHK